MHSEPPGKILPRARTGCNFLDPEASDNRHRLCGGASRFGERGAAPTRQGYNSEMEARMHIKRRRGWEIADRLATPEALALRRRGLLSGALAFSAGSLAAGAMTAHSARAADAAPGTAPATTAPPGAAGPLDDKYQPGRATTDAKAATTYNNYYEIDESKDIWRGAQKIPQRPWSISIGGMVTKPRSIDIDDLFKQVQFEERVYRHRCVEAWAMTVPWTGFPLSQLVKLADPLGSAKYMVFETAQLPKVMPGLDSPFYPWPYIEGVTMAEAANDLAFISTGMYGKPLPPQDGGPIRLTLPWKYGFKSAKALAKISFTDKQPVNFWQAIAPSEYGFWANVNPAVSHPRWSQAQERLLGTGEMVPTVIYNGYGDFVASLYVGLQNEKLFM
jgi:sulfoxide reductase catalytic subunit YedY